MIDLDKARELLAKKSQVGVAYTPKENIELLNALCVQYFSKEDSGNVFLDIEGVYTLDKYLNISYRLGKGIFTKSVEEAIASSTCFGVYPTSVKE